MIKLRCTLTPIPVTKYHVDYELKFDIYIDNKVYHFDTYKSSNFDDAIYGIISVCGMISLNVDELRDELFKGKSVVVEKEYKEGHYIQLVCDDEELSHNCTIHVLVFKSTKITDVIDCIPFILKSKDTFENKIKRLNMVQSELDIYGSPYSSSKSFKNKLKGEKQCK